jgi:hypothetical protein
VYVLRLANTYLRRHPEVAVLAMSTTMLDMVSGHDAREGVRSTYLWSMIANG